MNAKRILLIGGTHGICEVLFKKLNSQGLTVLSMARSSFATYSCDVTDLNQDLPSVNGPIDGLVYCPGTLNLKPFAQISLQDFEKDWRINVLGAFRVIQTYLEEIKKAQSASIVLFSTVVVKLGMPFHVSVGAAKGGIEGMTRSLAAELSPNIRVNSIAPSLTDTPLTSTILSNEVKRKTFANRHPLKRLGQPEDIANMAAFLLSDDASWITGQVFGVDGGMSSIILN